MTHVKKRLVSRKAITQAQTIAIAVIIIVAAIAAAWYATRPAPGPTPTPTPTPTATPSPTPTPTPEYYPEFFPNGTVNPNPTIRPAPDADKFAGKTLKLIMRDYDQTWEALRRFRLMYPDVIIEEEVMGSPAVYEKLKVAIATKMDYDVVYANMWQTLLYHAVEYNQPLDKYIEQEGGDAYLDQFLPGCVSVLDGYRYFIPFRMYIQILYYNAKMLADVGLKVEDITTYEEIMRQSPKLNKDIDGDGVIDIYAFGVAFGGRHIHLLDFFRTGVWAVGGQMFEPVTMKPMFNDTHGEYVVKIMRELVESGTTSPATPTFNEEDIAPMMAAGKFVFMMDYAGYTRLVDDPEQSKVVGQIECTIRPGYEFPGDPLPGMKIHRSSGIWGDEGYNIGAYGKNPDLAWRFIKMINGPSMQKWDVMALGRPPTLRILYEDETCKKILGREAAAIAEQVTYPHTVSMDVALGLCDDFQLYSEMIHAGVERYLHAAITGRLTPQEALRKMAEDCVELMPEH